MGSNKKQKDKDGWLGFAGFKYANSGWNSLNLLVMTNVVYKINYS